MFLLSLRIFLVVVACAIGAYTDKKTGYIYDWITLPLIAIGILLNIFFFSFSENISILVSGAAIFIIGFVIYYLGKMGGGDIKLFLGIHFTLPYINNQLFILWALVISCFLAVTFMSLKYLVIIFKKVKITKELLFSKSKISSIITSFCLFVAFIILLHFSINFSDMPFWFSFALIPIFLGLLLNIFQKEIKEHIYLLRKKVSEIEDGDVIATEFLSKSLALKLKPILKNKKVIEEKDIEAMKQKKIKEKIPIYYYLPRFGPYIFLGVVVSIVLLLLLF